MANDRMYLKCTCGEMLFLAKTQGGGYFTLDDDDTVKGLDKFFDEHAFCKKLSYDDEYSSNKTLTLIYETDEGSSVI